ncbi:MAG TPA: acetylglutamate kinase [Bryobacteraceae bacterium]|nr:acetylglutamate kinase [Bryobacteraceae bacterium]
MKILAKVGGTLLDAPESRANIAAQLASVASTHQLVVVHGGGKQLTRHLEERGIASRFVNGLRVSDDNVIDAALKVIAGSVNKQFVSALRAAGVSALGLSGVDGSLTIARQMNPALESVGAPVRSNGELLRLLNGAGYLPVVACLAGDEQGRVYNVNADQMAVSCAVAYGAEKLVFLTDVPGVKNAEGDVLARIDPDEIGRLIRSGVAHGGMQAKLEAGVAALAQGVEEVVIAPGQAEDVCARILAGEALGTRLSLSVPQPEEARC